MPPFTFRSRRFVAAALMLSAVACSAPVLSVPAAAQEDAFPGTRNIELVGRLTLADLEGDAGSAASAGGRTAGDIVIEQEPGRPYAYVARRAIPAGFYAVDLGDPETPRVLAAPRVGAPGTHAGVGATGLTYFRLGDRVLLVGAYRFDAGSPGSDRGLVVYDVTDPAAPREAAAVDAGPMDNVFAYKRAAGDVLLFAAGGGDVHVFDAARLAAGDAGDALLAAIPTPPLLQNDLTGFNDVYVAFHPETQTDRMYAAGAGGYHVFDVTDLAAPAHLTSINSAAIRWGLHATATPDGRFVVTSPRYRTAPMRIFDLRPALEGEIPEVRTAVGAWTANWRNVSRNHTLRWPYVFTASLEDGFHVFNLRDPAAPYTVAYYRTWLGPGARMADPEGEHHGAWDVDVRNRDGLIAVSDTDSGLWLFRLDEFDGWDGRGWGLPNVSSVQDWEHGPAASARGY